jgi:putative transcriptional regulator
MQIKLREVLDKKNKSIYQLNKETGIASSTLSRICNNKTSSIEFSILDKICEALDCDISDILIPEKSDTSQ